VIPEDLGDRIKAALKRHERHTGEIADHVTIRPEGITIMGHRKDARPAPEPILFSPPATSRGIAVEQGTLL
jgi:hypothetical protein